MIRIIHQTTVVNDTALRALQARLQGLRTHCATVGWHVAEGRRPKLRRGPKGAISSDWRVGLADVALIHETGSYARGIPARPVHLTAYRNAGYRRQLVSLVSREYRELLKGKQPGVVLQCIGSFWRSRFDLVFDGENNWPVLAEETLRRRRDNGNHSSQPLVDTRQMRDTTTAKVRLSALVERPVWGGQ